MRCAASVPPGLDTGDETPALSKGFASEKGTAPKRDFGEHDEEGYDNALSGCGKGEPVDRWDHGPEQEGHDNEGDAECVRRWPAHTLRPFVHREPEEHDHGRN